MDLNFDVLILGGSMEGCAAAAAAAERGLRTAVIENAGSLGGLSTNGLYSYFSGREGARPVSDAASAIQNELSLALGIDAGGTATLYREQMMKIALAEMLQRRGVVVFTHMFVSSPIVEGGELRGFTIGGKTGDKSFFASWIIDATEGFETAGYLGYGAMASGKNARLGIKMNGIALGELMASVRSVDLDNPLQAIGSFLFPFRWDRGGASTFCDELFFLADKSCGELIVHGLSAPVESLDPLVLSSLQMALRRGAYCLLEELKARAHGFAEARIIHAAPRMDLYGIRIPRGPAPYRNLFHCQGAAPGAYDSAVAIARGVGVAARLPAKLTG